MIRNKIVQKRSAKKQVPKKKKISKTAIIGGFVVLAMLPAFLALWYSSFSGSREAGKTLPPQAPGAPPEIVSARILPDAPRADETLSVEYQSRRTEDASVQYIFRWYVDGGIIQEGPGSTLAAGSIKKGESVSVEVIPSSANGQGNAFRSEPVTIGNIPPSVVSLSMEPAQPAPGAEITATAAGEDSDGDEISFRFQWTVNGELVSDLPPESNRFNTRGLRKKDDISVTVTPWDGESEGNPVMSEIVTLINSVPRITSTPPTSLNNDVYSYQVSASDSDGDKISFSLDQAPEGMTIDAVTGLITWEPPRHVSERREVPVKIKADDGDGGSGYQKYSLFYEMR